MIQCNNWPVGFCSWSLGNDFDKIKTLVGQTGLTHVHLAASPALAADGDKFLAAVKRLHLQVSATMIDFPQEDYSTLDSIKATGGIVPDNCWNENKQRVLDAVNLTVRLDVKFLTTHFGFLDLENPAMAKKLLDRVKILADKAAKKSVILLMETGQETADELKTFLEKLNHPALAVNFDPANMILYNKGDPIQAVQTLARWIKHIHIKDAARTQTPGTWGAEVPWGKGQVGTAEFLRTLKQINFKGALAVEREAGDDRIGDIKSAVDMLKTFKG